MYTRQIVNLINMQLAANAFSGSAFQGGILYGIALTAPKSAAENKTNYLPFVMDGDNEKYVGLDDTYLFQIYHKNNGVLKGIVPLKDDFGDGHVINKRTTNMSMILFAKYRGLQSEEWFDIIDKYFPEQLDLSTKSGLIGLYNADMKITTANFNAIQILQSEYKLEKMSIAPNDIVIQINYTIECTYRKDCIITACCTV